jgi:hypothetical protein
MKDGTIGFPLQLVHARNRKVSSLSHLMLFLPGHAWNIIHAQKIHPDRHQRPDGIIVQSAPKVRMYKGLMTEATFHTSL